MDRLAPHLRAVSLVLVAVMLPFETTAGALSVGGWTVTGLEGTLLVCAGIEVFFRLVSGLNYIGKSKSDKPSASQSERVSPGFLGWSLLFATCGLLSGVLAPEISQHLTSITGESSSLGHPIALKSAARLLVDALVGLSACALVARPPRWLPPRRLLGVVVGAATVSAVLGIAEQQWLDGAAVDPILWRFRGKATLAGGVRRLTSTFSQANVTAGFFALALPLSIALAWPRQRQQPQQQQQHQEAQHQGTRMRWLWLLSTTVLLWALLGTYSRGAMVAVASSVVATAIGVWRARRRQRASHVWTTLSVLAALFLGVVGVRLATDPALRNRLGMAPQGPQIRWTVALSDTPGDGEETQTNVTKPRRMRLKLHNTGWLAWRAGGSDPMRIHAVARDGSSRVVGENRTRLTGGVAPGAHQTVDAYLPDVGDAHDVTVRWRLEQHGRASYDAIPPAVQRLHANTRPRAFEPDAEVTDGRGRGARRGDLWPVAFARWQARPLVGWGADTFRLRWPSDLPTLRADRRMHANSLWLELLADLGLLGLVAFAGVLLWTLRRGRHGGPLAIGALVGVCTWALHGGVDCLLYFHGPAVLFWICAGVANGLAGSYSVVNAKRRNAAV